MNKNVLLMILDGWGLATNPAVSAIDKANTPFVDSLFKRYPHSKLEASGLAVGLPEGQMGNSEVGHMNIGAGRIVYQDLVKINLAVQHGELLSHPVLSAAFARAKAGNKKVHLCEECVKGLEEYNPYTEVVDIVVVGKIEECDNYVNEHGEMPNV